MEATDAGPPALLPDEDGRIAGDLACIHCGYNLRTLQMRGVCPECGKAVSDSVQCSGPALAKWLEVTANAVSSATYLLLGELVILWLVGLSLALHSGWSRMLVPVAVLVGGALFIMLVRLTAQDPVQARRREGISARRVARACLVLLAAGVYASCIAVGWGPVLEDSRSGFPVGSRTALLFAILLALPAVAVLPLALALHVRVLMERAGRRDFARRALWIFGAAAAVEALGVGAFGYAQSTAPTLPLVELAALVVGFVGSVFLPFGCIALSSVAGALRAARRRAVEQLNSQNHVDAGEPGTVSSAEARDVP